MWSSCLLDLSTDFFVGNMVFVGDVYKRQPDMSAVVWSGLPFISSGQNRLARHSERGKKTRQTEEEVERQHQGMDRPGVRYIPEGNGE